MDIREIVVPDAVIRVSDIRDLRVMTMPQAASFRVASARCVDNNARRQRVEA